MEQNVFLFLKDGKAKDGKDVIMEKEIHEYIFDGMNKDIRPEIKHGVPTHVHFDMKLQKIVNLVSVIDLQHHTLRSQISVFAVIRF